MTSRTNWAGIALTVALCAHAAPATAQDAAALATRRDLIGQAQTARTNNDHQNALAIAERAARIQMSPSLRLFIAQEQNSLGRLSEALGNADQCARDAEGDTAVRNREQVAEACRALANDVRPRVGRVTVTAPSPAPDGLHITVAGAALNDALWGVPYVVTPGAIVIEASANGYVTFHRSVDVAAGATVEVPVQLEHEAAATPTPVTTPAPAPAATHSGGGISVPGVALVGLGVAAGIFAAVAWFGPHSSNIAQATMHCPNFTCPTQADLTAAQPFWNGAQTWTIAADVGLVVGILGIGAGAALILLGGHHDDAPPAPRTTVQIAPTQGGFMLGLQGTL